MRQISVTRRTLVKTAALGLAGTMVPGAGWACASEKGASAGGDAERKVYPASTIPVVASEEYEDGDIIDVDLVIIGAGYAGLWTAITAADAGVGSVALVDKGTIGISSVASLTSGTSAFCLDGIDDIDDMMTETLKTTDYLGRQDLWLDQYQTSQRRYDKLVQWGCTYAPADQRMCSDGNVYTKLSPFLGYKGIPAGKGVVACLIDQLLQRPQVRCYAKTMIVELLKDGDRVVGAAGFNKLTGAGVAFRAKATVIAAGKGNFRGQHAMGEGECGDSYRLAYEAGATLDNMEFMSFDVDPKGYNMEGATLLGAFGARFVNKAGDEYTWDYDPVSGPVTNCWTAAFGVASENDKGNGPCYLDRTTDEYRNGGYLGYRQFFGENTWQAINEDLIAASGMDCTKTLQELTPTLFGIIGGIVVDEDCATSIEGLWAAGTPVSVDPGKTKGQESARAYWSGEKCGTATAAYVEQAESPALDDDSVTQTLTRITGKIGQKGSVAPNDLVREIQEAIFDYRVCILKSQDTLQGALDKLGAIIKRLDDVAIDDPHQLANFYELSSIGTCADLYLRASLERTESRNCHYRVDYPQTSDDWRAWIEWTKGNDGEPQMQVEDIPLDAYPYQPAE